ncbi:MAG: hypothetical protein Q8Q59_14240 [Luteolibacter sp.]|nr:hypothetical protein [Luteolibacter sp.]
MGRRVWLLIPFMAALGLSLQIPGQPSSLLLAQALVLAFCALLFLMRRLPYRLAWTELELWIVILTLCVAQVYLRNPVNVSLFGGDTVGGKGYILYAIALASALLFCSLRVPANELKWVIPLSIFGALGNAAVSIIGNFVPIIGLYTGTGGYSQSNEAGYDAQVVDSEAATRIGFLGAFGKNLSLWISSYISPLKACFRPLWLILILVVVVAAGLSGFRNVIALVGVTLLLGIAYRSGFGGVALSIFGGIGGLVLLALLNTIHPLPPNIQRSLTFLPGTWEERYKRDAEGSSEWRFEIWREVLLTDRWIQNKWLGDGLGFTAAELTAQMNQREGSRAGLSGFDIHRENILSNGDYHSGPVSTVRIIGYLGLIIFLLAQIRLAVHAHRQILRCRGTEWFPLALFTGIPLIYGPLFFVFIFGDFRSNSVAFLLAVGMIRLLENNLPLPAYVVKRRTPYILQNRRTLQDSAPAR